MTRRKKPRSEIFAEEDEAARTRSHRGGGRRDEARRAQQADSNFGKVVPGRPTAQEVLTNVGGAGSIPFEDLPPETQTELTRLRRQGPDGVINPGHSLDPKEARPRSQNPLAEHPKTTM